MVAIVEMLPDLTESIDGGGRLTRAQVVDRIRAINPTADEAILDRFGDAALRLYMDHLAASSVPRGRGATWVRPGDTPAVLTFVPED